MCGLVLIFSRWHTQREVSRTLTFSLAALGYGHCAGLTLGNWHVNGFVSLGTWSGVFSFGEENGIKPVNDSVPVQMPYSRSDPHRWMLSLPFQLVSFLLKLKFSWFMGCLGGLVVKNPPANAGDTGLILGLGRSPGEGNGNTLQYSCLAIPWTEDPGGLQSMGHKRVRHNTVTKWQQQQHSWFTTLC